jgi:ABC-type Zn uptake system ZnuABC Zn-binding protein ZnuA
LIEVVEKEGYKYILLEQSLFNKVAVTLQREKDTVALSNHNLEAITDGHL